MSEWKMVDKRGLELVSHASTQGMGLGLKLLQGEPFKHILDIGCGSGITTLAAAECWPEAQIIASDIHEEAVQHAQANVVQNGFTQRITVLRAEGPHHRDILARAPFDLILANLVAEQHLRYAHDYTRLLRPGGKLLLGGMMAWKAPVVMQALQGQGYQLITTINRENWQTQLWEKPA